MSPQALSGLIGSIYDCVLDPSRWDETLGKLRDAFNGQTAALSLMDVRGTRQIIHKTVGIEPHWLAMWPEHNAEIVTVLSEHITAYPSLDEPHIMRRHLSPQYIEASLYCQTLLKPAGIVDIIQYILMNSAARFSGLGVGRNANQGLITEREVELGRLLLPHLRRAVTISNVLDASTVERSRMAEALDALRCAVILTDARGVVLHANRIAQSILRAGGLVRDARGVLQATLPPAASQLRTAIALAAGDESRIGEAGLSIRLTDGNMPPVLAYVLPLSGSDLRTRLQPSAAAAVFIGVTPDEEDAAEVMAAVFELSPAEKKVLASLLSGRTLAETAAALSIAASTANTHLDHIFLKTGVSRQTELMRLGGRLVPPTRTSD
jgi:DNA-binding CsgD family transcriptional regulator